MSAAGAETQWPAWQQRLQAELSAQRYRHCLAVHDEAARLAQIWGLNGEQARMAGLLHDVARELPFPELHARAAAAGYSIGLAEEANPVILHAPVGAIILREDWGISDEAVLAAVRHHTVASPEMDRLCQIIFLSDLIEPERRKWPDQAEIRALAEQNLAQAMAAALASNFRYLRQQGRFIHPQAYRAYEHFKAHS